MRRLDRIGQIFTGQPPYRLRLYHHHHPLQTQVPSPHPENSTTTSPSCTNSKFAQTGNSSPKSNPHSNAHRRLLTISRSIRNELCLGFCSCMGRRWKGGMRRIWRSRESPRSWGVLMSGWRVSPHIRSNRSLWLMRRIGGTRWVWRSCRPAVTTIVPKSKKLRRVLPTFSGSSRRTDLRPSWFRILERY